MFTVSKMRVIIITLLSLWILQFLVICSDAASPNKENPQRILVLGMLGSKSMKNFYEPLVVNLAERGNDMTVVSPYPTKSHARIRDILTPNLMGLGFIKKVNPFEIRLKGQVLNPFNYLNDFSRVCQDIYEMDEIKKLRSETFDLVISSYTFNECGFGFIDHFKVPFILLQANVMLPWNNPLGTPYPLSFVPLPFFDFSDKMTFVQRIKNVALTGVVTLVDKFYRVPEIERIYRNFFGEHASSADDIAANASLIFTNSHFSLNYPRPTMPDIIEVGGMHCMAGKPVEKRFSDFIAEAGPDGFIVFSMGSVVQVSSMPEQLISIFVKAFAKLKERVIMKWEGVPVPNMPSNVLLAKWLPQQDLLAHKNIKLFITHGGLHSIEEAVYHGVPLLGLPAFGDQDANLAAISNHEFSVALNVANLTEDHFFLTIRSIIDNKRYALNAKKLSSLYADRPLGAMDSALYWVEYVIRHQGAHHLRSAARNLNILQYYCLDVYVAVFLVLWLLKFILWNLMIKRCFFSKSGGPKISEPKRKTKAH